MDQRFKDYAMDEHHPQYKKAISREEDLYQRRNDLRSEFGRDYTRIIFSEAYRRLKNKTQVFFAPHNDHVCTRIEHVNLVESISHTIGEYLGLNTELIKAIAVGHDLGHAPFGHGGETILTQLAIENGLPRFWHEKNSLHFVDDIELLDDNKNIKHNLNLTYAVRDGMIAHCGEMNQQYIQKREEAIDLDEYQYAGQYNPWTYEGCVVKMADKIAYLARDIEDALRLNIITLSQVNELRDYLNTLSSYQFVSINNGSIVNYFINDVVKNSCIEKGIGLSLDALHIMQYIMKFNYKNIYLNAQLTVHNQYVSLILTSLYNTLYTYTLYDDVMKTLQDHLNRYPKLIGNYIDWLNKYALLANVDRNPMYQNKILYDFISDPSAPQRSIIDYLAGMSDSFIKQLFEELISF